MLTGTFLYLTVIGLSFLPCWANNSQNRVIQRHYKGVTGYSDPPYCVTNCNLPVTVASRNTTGPFVQILELKRESPNNGVKITMKYKALQNVTLLAQNFFGGDNRNLASYQDVQLSLDGIRQVSYAKESVNRCDYTTINTFTINKGITKDSVTVQIDEVGHEISVNNLCSHGLQVQPATVTYVQGSNVTFTLTITSVNEEKLTQINEYLSAQVYHVQGEADVYAFTIVETLSLYKIISWMYHNEVATLTVQLNTASSQLSGKNGRISFKMACPKSGDPFIKSAKWATSVNFNMVSQAARSLSSSSSLNH